MREKRQVYRLNHKLNNLKPVTGCENTHCTNHCTAATEAASAILDNTGNLSEINISEIMDYVSALPTCSQANIVTEMVSTILSTAKNE